MKKTNILKQGSVKTLSALLQKKSNNTAKISWRADHIAGAIAPAYKNITPDRGFMFIRNYSLSIVKLAELKKRKPSPLTILKGLGLLINFLSR